MTYFLAIADFIVIPTTPEIAAIRGALHIKDFAQSAGFTKKLDLLFVRNEEDSSSEVMAQLKVDFHVLEPAISEDALVAHSQMTGKSVLSTNKDSQIASDYREICYSILEELELI
jgi:cellulose biosynthesis protein BcsQ